MHIGVNSGFAHEPIPINVSSWGILFEVSGNLINTLFKFLEIPCVKSPNSLHTGDLKKAN